MVGESGHSLWALLEALIQSGGTREFNSETNASDGSSGRLERWWLDETNLTSGMLRGLSKGSDVWPGRWTDKGEESSENHPSRRA